MAAFGDLKLSRRAALGVMGGAIISHLTVLGLEVKNDGGLLFLLAIAVFAASVTVLFIRRGQLPVLGSYLEMVR